MMHDSILRLHGTGGTGWIFLNGEGPIYMGPDKFLHGQKLARFHLAFTPRGAYLTKCYTGRLRPKFRPLALLYTILAEKVPLLYTVY